VTKLVIAVISIFNIFSPSKTITHMKKSLLTICFAVISLTGFAQLPSFGVKAGVNFANQSLTGSNVLPGGKALATLNAGVFADFKFGNLSLQPALNFTGEGTKYALVISDNSGHQTGTANETETIYYLKLPVNLLYHVPVVIGNIYFGAGPYIAQGLSGKYKFPETNGDAITTAHEPVHFGNDAGDVKAQQYGADFILGLQFKNGFLVNANYDLGLSNDAPAAENASSKSRVFGISVGYKF
jgi:hypothetical protein